jgi:hypothetical protein
MNDTTFLAEIPIYYSELPTETQDTLKDVFVSGKQQVAIAVQDDVRNHAHRFKDKEMERNQEDLAFYNLISGDVEETRSNAASKFYWGAEMRLAVLPKLSGFIGKAAQKSINAFAAELQDHNLNVELLTYCYDLTPEEANLLSAHCKSLFRGDQYCLSLTETPGSCRIKAKYFKHNNYSYKGMHEHLAAISGSGLRPSDLFATTRSLSPTVSDENICGQFDLDHVAKITTVRIDEAIRHACGLHANVTVGSDEWKSAFRLLQTRRNCQIQLDASFKSDRHQLVFYQNISNLCRISFDDLFAAQGESCLTSDSLFTEL